MPIEPNVPKVATAVKRPAVQKESSQSLPIQKDSLSESLSDSLSDTLADPLGVQFSVSLDGPAGNGGGDDAPSGGPGAPDVVQKLDSGGGGGSGNPDDESPDPLGESPGAGEPIQMAGDGAGGSVPGPDGVGAPGGSGSPFEGWGPAGLGGARSHSGKSSQAIGTAGSVQMAAEGPVKMDGPGAVAVVRSKAAQGLTGASTALPHLDKIQHSFGRHDVGGVKAHVGGAAKTASEGMGARAYASGDNVAFKSSPDLKTAAHEAAHVVQQRAGVSLSGGVGKAGDTYERHADVVADAVVQGRSAEDLLAGGRSGGDSPAVQKSPASEAVQFADELTDAQKKSLNAAIPKVQSAGSAAEGKKAALFSQAESKETMLRGLDTGPKQTFLDNYKKAWDDMTAVLQQAGVGVAEMEASADLAAGIAIAILCGLTVGVGAEALIVGKAAKTAVTKLGPRLLGLARRAAAEGVTEGAEQAVGEGLDAAGDKAGADAAREASKTPPGKTPAEQAGALDNAFKNALFDFLKVIGMIKAVDQIHTAALKLELEINACLRNGTSAALGTPEEVVAEVANLQSASTAAAQVANSGTPFAKSDELKSKVESTASTENYEKITFDLWLKWLEKASVSYVMQDVVWNKLTALGIVGPNGLFGDVGAFELVEAVRMRSKVQKYIGTVQPLDYPAFEVSEMTLDGERFAVTIQDGYRYNSPGGPPPLMVRIIGTSANNYTWGADAALICEPDANQEGSCTEDEQTENMDQSQIEQWEHDELDPHVGSMQDLSEIYDENSGYILLAGRGYSAANAGTASFRDSDGFVRVTGYTRDNLNRGPRYAVIQCQPIVNGQSRADGDGNCES